MKLFGSKFSFHCHASLAGMSQQAPSSAGSVQAKSRDMDMNMTMTTPVKQQQQEKDENSDPDSDEDGFPSGKTEKTN